MSAEMQRGGKGGTKEVVGSLGFVWYGFKSDLGKIEGIVSTS